MERGLLERSLFSKGDELRFVDKKFSTNYPDFVFFSIFIDEKEICPYFKKRKKKKSNSMLNNIKKKSYSSIKVETIIYALLD